MAEVTTATPAQTGSVLNEKAIVEQNTSTTANVSRPESVRSAASFKSTSSQPTPASSATAASAATEREEEWKLPTNGPLKTPIPRPEATTKPIPQADLTPEQKTKYATVLAAVSQWTTLPSTTAKNAAQTPIQDHERMFLTRECLLRYLRATKWKPAEAIKRLQGTLSWRREYGADTFTHDYISPENETGKQIQLGFDNDQRPVLYLSPAKQNTKMSDRQIHHLCYMLDRTIDMMPPGVESNCLVVNFKGTTNGSIPTVGQSRAVLNILQTHNPERLGKALICETPWYVNTFFKLISSFIDPVTREKMKFNEDMRTYVPKNQLWDEFQGDVKFEYEHGIYWKTFGEECEKRRAAYRKRWEDGGKQVGEFEEYLRGGGQRSLREVEGQLKEEEKDVDLVAAEVGKLSV